MIDLFVVVPPKRAVPRVHLLEESPESKRREYEREWYLKNREKRLAAMKARYESRRAEYIEKAKAWAAQNREKVRKIKRNSKLRKKTLTTLTTGSTENRSGEGN